MFVPGLVAVGVLALALAVLLLLRSTTLRKDTGLPSGKVLQSDTSVHSRGKRLFSARYQLSGTPDYVVSTAQGLVPVEVKPSRTDSVPHDSHLLQVLAYCLLMEEVEGKPPPYGLLRYSSGTFKVDYNKQTRAYLLSVLDEMRQAETEAEVHRSHDVPGRCRACAFREVCEEALMRDA